MGDLTTHRMPTPVHRRPGSAPPGRKPDGAGPIARILQLQRQAGNQAVVKLLQRDVSHPENPPVTTTNPAGTMTDAQWTTAYHAAAANPSVAAYAALFRDIAITAGMAALPGFDLTTIPPTDGTTAKPGLNITLSTSGHPGHTGWVDKNGKFGIPLNLTRKAPDVSIAIILGVGALRSEKGLSLNTVRHEMVHARHKMKVLDAVKAWQTSKSRSGFDDWLKQQAKQKKMSELDVALVTSGSKDLRSNTEVLAYVEGFTNDYHRRAPTAAAAGPSFFELLGVAETEKVYPWSQASAAVKQEALTRLQEYRTSLRPDHQRLWKEWLDKQRAASAKDKTGRKEFLAELAKFVV